MKRTDREAGAAFLISMLEIPAKQISNNTGGGTAECPTSYIRAGKRYLDL